MNDDAGLTVQARAWRSEHGGRVRSLAGSSWLIGALVALAAWNVILGNPSGGLDSSWQWAIYAAAHRGMHFGTHIVFTYGPLGFLATPLLWSIPTSSPGLVLVI